MLLLILCFDVGCFILILKCTRIGLTCERRSKTPQLFWLCLKHRRPPRITLNSSKGRTLTPNLAFRHLPHKHDPSSSEACRKQGFKVLLSFCPLWARNRYLEFGTDNHLHCSFSRPHLRSFLPRHPPPLLLS